MDIEQARIAGGWAREAGRPESTCPTYAPGELGEPSRKAWREGWRSTDEKLRRERK